ncbi:MAG: amidohydrolase family protein [Lentisphaerae bacterium]|jgi:predicted TIM-barrel fold metal-dependent hydrolase|nr:amidohydrolase family protein [Lentisphaerota bacterium]
MFIDIHAHAYRRPVPFVCRFCTAEELLKLYDEADIKCGFILPIVSPEIYFPQANEDILDMCADYPGRFLPFCNIDPRLLTNACDAPLDTVLRYYKDKGCLGVGEIMPNIPMRDPMVQNLFKHAQAVGMPVTFDGSDQHGGDFGLYDEPGMPQLEHSLQRFPKLNFIAHGPVFWYEIGRLESPAQRKPPFFPEGGQARMRPLTGPIQEEGVVPKFFRYYENLYGELSDAYTPLACDEDYGPKFLTEFQDRLFFGTDTCGPNHRYKMRELLLRWRDEKRISQSVFTKIAHDNAVKFFKLSIPLAGSGE